MESERITVNIDDINQKNSENVYKLISRGEDAYIEQVREIANQISIYGKRIVLITGPSSAGKTTSSMKLQQELKALGISSHVLNMDDFFRPLKDVPVLPNGKHDIEGIGALDVECVRGCLDDILKKGETKTPTFDFASHSRTDKWKKCQVSKNGVVIMEGIHALNPIICEGLDNDKIYRVYVHCNTNFVFKNKIVFEARELRFLRRLVRDERERNCTYEKTISVWDDVCAGEDKNIRPYKNTANYHLNSTHFYEPLLYKDLLLTEFDKRKDNPTIKKYVEKFRVCSTVSIDFVPEDSLLREFIGD